MSFTSWRTKNSYASLIMRRPNQKVSLLLLLQQVGVEFSRYAMFERNAKNVAVTFARHPSSSF